MGVFETDQSGTAIVCSHLNLQLQEVNLVEGQLASFHFFPNTEKIIGIYWIFFLVTIPCKSIIAGQDTLEIRGGNNSASPLLATFGSGGNLTGMEFKEREAVFVHLNALCNEDRRLKAVFTSFSFAQGLYLIITVIDVYV